MPGSGRAGSRRRGGRGPINTPAEAQEYLVREFGSRAEEVLTNAGAPYARVVREIVAALPVLEAIQEFVNSLQDVRPIRGTNIPGVAPPENGRVTLGSLIWATQAIYQAVTALSRQVQRLSPAMGDPLRKVAGSPWLLPCAGALAHLHHEVPEAPEFLPKDLEALGVILGLDSDPRIPANSDKWRKRLPEVLAAAAALNRTLFPSSGDAGFDPPDLTGLLGG